MESIKKFKVEGMSCKNCKAHIERDIAALDGIDSVVAELETGEVTVSGIYIDVMKVKNAVEQAGYVFKE
jgi:copper chaperone CopZ